MLETVTHQGYPKRVSSRMIHNHAIHHIADQSELTATTAKAGPYQYNPTPSSGIFTKGDSHTCSYPALGRRAPPHWRYRVFVFFLFFGLFDKHCVQIFIFFTESFRTPNPQKEDRARSATSTPTTQPQGNPNPPTRTPIGALERPERRDAWIARAQGVAGESRPLQGAYSASTPTPACRRSSGIKSQNCLPASPHRARLSSFCESSRFERNFSGSMVRVLVGNPQNLFISYLFITTG